MTETGRARGYSNLPETAETEAQPQRPETPTIISYSEPDQVKNTSMLKRILKWRKYIILLLTPILLMPIPIAISGTVSSLLLSVSCLKATVLSLLHR